MKNKEKRKVKALLDVKYHLINKMACNSSFRLGDCLRKTPQIVERTTIGCLTTQPTKYGFAKFSDIIFNNSGYLNVSEVGIPPLNKLGGPAEYFMKKYFEEMKETCERMLEYVNKELRKLKEKK